MTVVMKFGGTSVGTAESLQNVRDIVKSRSERKPIVVVSAVGGVTDLLIDSAKAAVKGDDYSEMVAEIEKKHNDILEKLDLPRDLVKERLDEFKDLIKLLAEGKEMNDQVMDYVVSFGERMSCRIVAAYLDKSGMPAKKYYAYDIGMKTDSNFGEAEILKETYAEIGKNLDGVDHIPVVTGFIAKDDNDAITTLGRGGSDYSAAIVGAAVKADAIEIWTDVSGILTADPRVVPEAERIDKITFAEASELAFFGAKVLHPKTIIPAVDKDIPVKILNTHEPDNPGTTIVNDLDVCVPDRPVTAITAKKGVQLVNIVSTRMLFAHGFLHRLFAIFEKHHISVDMIATTEVSVTVTVHKKFDLQPVIEELGNIAKVKLIKDRAIICVVGKCMAETLGMASRMFTVTYKNGINVEMISQGSSEINTSFVIEDKYADKCVKEIHKEFFKR